MNKDSCKCNEIIEDTNICDCDLCKKKEKKKKETNDKSSTCKIKKEERNTRKYKGGKIECIVFFSILFVIYFNTLINKNKIKGFKI